MNSKRIEEIQKQTAYPESQSVFTALHQVWNEVGQEYQAEIRQLEQQLREKEARIARLESVIGYYVTDLLNNGFTSKTVNAMKDVINETQQQSLTEHDASVIGCFLDYLFDRYPIMKSFSKPALHRIAERYANQLRQQADKG
jgi:ferritin-like metal-binding protein YciE